MRPFVFVNWLTLPYLSQKAFAMLEILLKFSFQLEKQANEDSKTTAKFSSAVLKNSFNKKQNKILKPCFPSVFDQELKIDIYEGQRQPFDKRIENVPILLIVSSFGVGPPRVFTSWVQPHLTWRSLELLRSLQLIVNGCSAVTFQSFSPQSKTQKIHQIHEKHNFLFSKKNI